MLAFSMYRSAKSRDTKDSKYGIKIVFSINECHMDFMFIFHFVVAKHR